MSIILSIKCLVNQVFKLLKAMRFSWIMKVLTAKEDAINVKIYYSSSSVQSLSLSDRNHQKYNTRGGALGKKPTVSVALKGMFIGLLKALRIDARESAL